MIVFDLRCGHGHVFEAWFASGDTFDAQQARGLIACPLCNDSEIRKAAMAPAIPAKANAVMPDRGGGAAALLAAQREIEARAVYVGGDFARRARALHGSDSEAGGAGAGADTADCPGTAIYGEASLADARGLIEDGIPILPLNFRPRIRSDA